MAKVFHLSVLLGPETTLTMSVVMDVTTEDGEVTLPYLLHRRKRDVQVTHSGLREALCGLTLFKESEATTGLLARIPDLKRHKWFFLLFYDSMYSFRSIAAAQFRGSVVATDQK